MTPPAEVPQRVSPLLGVLAGGIASIISVALLLVARPTDPYVGMIFGVPLVGGLIAVLRPMNRFALIVAAIFIAFGAVQLLLGLAGLLYVPSVVMLAAGAVALRRKRTA